MFPIYGKNGSIKQTIKINKGLKENTLLIPGQVLHFPDLYREVAESNRPENNQENAEIKLHQKVRQKYLQLSPAVTWIRYKTISNNGYSTAQATAISDMNYSLNGTFNFVLNDKYSAGIEGDLSRIQLYRDDTYSFSKRNFMSKKLFITTLYKANPNQQLQLKAGMTDKTFLSLKSKNTISVDTYQTPELNLRYEWNALHFSSSRIALGLLSKIELPYNSGINDQKLTASFGIRGDLIMHDHSIFLGYEDTVAKTSANKTTENKIIMGIAFSMGMQ